MLVSKALADLLISTLVLAFNRELIRVYLSSPCVNGPGSNSAAPSALSAWQLLPVLAVGTALETGHGHRLLVSLTSSLPASPVRKYSIDHPALAYAKAQRTPHHKQSLLLSQLL